MEINTINYTDCCLGKGQTRKQAVNKVIAFEVRDPKRAAILSLLTDKLDDEKS